VLSAVNAAREPDRRLLAQLHDQLRPSPNYVRHPLQWCFDAHRVLRPQRDWAPPYNIVSRTTKAQTIREAMQAVASELPLSLELLS
jgi:hypothetical protein